MGWNPNGPRLKIQPLVDATLRRLQWQLDRPDVTHKRLHVRVHENNAHNYSVGLARGLLKIMGEPDLEFTESRDAYSVVVRFKERYKIDFDFWQQVYLDPAHCFVEYESSDDVVMLFDCTQQLKGQYR